MNIEELIKENPNISITIKGSDLIEFAENIANKAVNDALEKREEKLFSREETIKLLNISSSTLWRWQNLEIIKVRKLGQKCYFPQSEIDRIMKNKLLIIKYFYMNKLKTKEGKINFYLVKSLTLGYLHAYNTGRPLNGQLKNQHLEHFYKLVQIATSDLKKRKFRKDLQDVFLEEEICVSSNSPALARLSYVSARTIRNYNSRLVESGLMRKEFRGTSQNYVLRLNPFLVFYVNSSDYTQVPGFLCESQLLGNFISNCNTKNFPLLTQYYENKELKRKKVENINFKGLNSVQDLDYLLQICFDEKYIAEPKRRDEIRKSSNFPISTKNQENKKKLPPEFRHSPQYSEELIKEYTQVLQQGHIMRLRATDIRTQKIAHADIIYNHSLTSIPGWEENSYPELRGKIVMYIVETYMSKFDRIDRIKSFTKYAIDAISIAASYIEKKIICKEWENFHTLPVTWFDIKYDKGFVKAMKYYEKHKEKQKKERINQARREVNKYMNEMLNEYFKAPSTESYTQCLNRIKEKYPARAKQFQYCAKNKIRKIEDNWQSKTTKVV